jgi:hypothetical protein
VQIDSVKKEAPRRRTKVKLPITDQRGLAARLESAQKRAPAPSEALARAVHLDQPGSLRRLMVFSWGHRTTRQNQLVKARSMLLSQEVLQE